MSGPEGLTPPEEVELIAAAIGQEVRFEEQTPQEYLDGLAPVVGVETAQWLLDGFRMMAEHPMKPEPAVAELPGRPPVTYREWALANANAFRCVMSQDIGDGSVSGHR